jgi:hypothetical protein
MFEGNYIIWEGSDDVQIMVTLEKTISLIYADEQGAAADSVASAQ